MAVSVAVACPAGALAQGSAGDDQYQDPFGARKARSRAPESRPMPRLPAPTPGAGAGAGADASPAGGTGATDTAAGPATTTVSTPAGSASASPLALPRTGAEPWLEALAGTGLLLTGFGVRLRARGA